MIRRFLFIISVFLCLCLSSFAQRLPVDTIAQLREGFMVGFPEALKTYTGEGIAIYYLEEAKRDLTFLKTVDRTSLVGLKKIINQGSRDTQFLFNALFSPDAQIKFLSFEDLEKGEEKKILHSVIVIDNAEYFISEATEFKGALKELVQKNIVIAPYNTSLVDLLKQMDLIDRVLVSAPFDPDTFYPASSDDLYNLDIDLFSPTISSSLISFNEGDDEDERQKKINEYKNSPIHEAILASGASLILEKLKKDKNIDPITDARSMLWNNAKKLWFPGEDKVVYFDTVKHAYESNEIVRNYIRLIDMASTLGMDAANHSRKAMNIDKLQEKLSGKDIKIAVIDESFIENSSSLIPSIILHEVIGNSARTKLPGPGFTISKEITNIAPDAKIIALESKISEFPKAIDRALELMADIIVLRNLGEETESKINLSLQKAHKAGIIVITPSYCGKEKEVTIFEALTSGVSFGREKSCGQKNALKVSLDTTILPSFDFREDVPHLTAIHDIDRLSITSTMAGVSALLLEKKNDLAPSEIKKVFKASRREFGFKNKIFDGQQALEELDRLAMKKEVEEYSDKMKKHIENLIAAKDKESLREELSTCFSFPHMSKLALGNHWALISAGEKEEFLSLLKENLIKGLIQVILKKEGKPEITVKESKTKGNEATVKAYVKQKEVDIELIFQFVKLDDTWLVYDVTVDNASLLERYKHDFQEYMKKHSFNQLLNKMRKNLENIPNS